MSHLPAYLDNQATTPLDSRVRDAMWPYFDGRFGNPHSTDHAYGWEASDAVRVARAQVAHLINADDAEIVFTSGATESCNIALRGVAKASKRGRRRIITLATEHRAVLETVQALQDDGFEAAVLPVASDGLIDLAELERALDDDVLIVSVMAANNEIGIVQPLVGIADLCREAGALLHTDATQAAGRIAIDVDAWNVDLLSISAHKVYGPKGVGALFFRSGTSLEAITTGGGQEGGLRPGTVPTPLAVGFGEACQIASDQWQEDAVRMCKLTSRLKTGLRDACPNIRFFGNLEHRIPGSLSIGFPGASAHEVLGMVSHRIAVSTGSACASSHAEASSTLLALGLDPDTAATAVRVSLGRFTTEDDIDTALDAFRDVAAAVRRR